MTRPNDTKPNGQPSNFPAPSESSNALPLHIAGGFNLADLPADALLDDAQAAAALSVKPGTLAVWRSCGRYNLPYLKIGRLVRYIQGWRFGRMAGRPGAYSFRRVRRKRPMNTQKKSPTRGAKSKQNKFPIKSDIQRIAAAALASAESVLGKWLPNGKRSGAEYIALNPTRSDGSPGSFSVNTTTGEWSDFATGDAGGDLVSLVAYLDGCGHMSEAAARLADFLHIPLVDSDHPAPAAGSPRPTTPKPEPQQEPERPILPIPAEALPTKPTANPAHGKPSSVWQYRDAAGGLLFEVWRFDPHGKRKAFSPLTYWPPGAWKWKASPAPRPLYGLDRLAARPDAPVLLCEGEKATDAAAGLLPGLVCIATMNGAQSPDKTDWSPLRNRRLFIWPDNDEPGQKFAKAAARLALDAGAASVEILDLRALAINPTTREPCELPKGWDAADAPGRGWNADNLAPALQWRAFKTTPATAATNPKPATPGAGAFHHAHRLAPRRRVCLTR